MKDEDNSIQDICSALIKTVERYETNDGKNHYSMSCAMSHQKNIERARIANQMLEDGKSIGAILEWAEIKVEDDILYQVTKDSKLVISYWQCRDTPGYRPISFNNRMMVYCYGDAGSWAGRYGNDVEIKCLIRYAKDSQSIISPIAENNKTK